MADVRVKTRTHASEAADHAIPNFLRELTGAPKKVAKLFVRVIPAFAGAQSMSCSPFQAQIVAVADDVEIGLHAESSCK